MDKLLLSPPSLRGTVERGRSSEMSHTSPEGPQMSLDPRKGGPRQLCPHPWEMGGCSRGWYQDLVLLIPRPHFFLKRRCHALRGSTTNGPPVGHWSHWYSRKVLPQRRALAPHGLALAMPWDAPFPPPPRPESGERRLLGHVCGRTKLTPRPAGRWPGILVPWPSQGGPAYAPLAWRGGSGAFAALPLHRRKD